MREAMFIKKNADKWQEYQHVPTNDPDEQSNRFIDLLDDLSYSKTFYPYSKATQWINGIAASIYQKIYQNKKEKYSRIGLFWKRELPMAMYNNRKILYSTFFICIICVLLAVWSSMQNYNFVKGFLGEDMVERTQEHIRSGDPFGYYNSEDKFSMFAVIMFNNILVAFISYVGGITFGIVTLWQLFRTCLMIGTFQYMQFAEGFGWQSVLVIWIHGTIEIFSFVLSSMAGFIIAKGIMFPATYKRIDSFRMHMKDSIKIIIALVPFFIVAAFLESYITYLSSNRFNKENDISLPIWASVFILIASFSFMVWYFIIYPKKVNKKYGQDLSVQNLQLMYAD